MKYQKERCLHCDRLKRPTDLPLKYPGFIDEAGTVALTEYWFCSLKCYEEELKKYLDKLYWPEYTERNPPPSIAAQGDAMIKELFDTFTRDTFEGMSYEERKSFIDQLASPYYEQYQAILKSWSFQQYRALFDANVSLRTRIEEEYDHRWNKEQEDYLQGLDDLAKSVEKGIAKDWALIEDLKRKEEERQRREDERRTREEERLRDKQERENEKRRKEEEAQAAREAEEQKWRPRPFEL